MRPCEIQVGKTYCNRGKGRTRREVLEVYLPEVGDWVVRFQQISSRAIIKTYDLGLIAFARWAGAVVEAAEAAERSGE